MNVISMAKKESTITVSQLLENGWLKKDDPIISMEKNLTDKESDDYDPDNGELKLVLHRMMNIWQFSVELPDGGLLNINPASIKELNKFERMIIGYMPNY